MLEVLLQKPTTPNEPSALNLQQTLCCISQDPDQANFSLFTLSLTENQRFQLHPQGTEKITATSKRTMLRAVYLLHSATNPNILSLLLSGDLRNTKLHPSFQHEHISPNKEDRTRLIKQEYNTRHLTSLVLS